MAKLVHRIKARIEGKRAAGQTPAEIGRYVRAVTGSNPHLQPDTLGLFDEERRMSQPTLPEMVARQRKAAKRAKQEAWLAEQRANSTPPEVKKSLRGGMSPTAAMAKLGCTKTELNRWAADGRFPPDGERHYRGVKSHGGSQWGRAWLPATVETATLQVDSWRQMDATAKKFRRTGLEVVRAK